MHANLREKNIYDHCRFVLTKHKQLWVKQTNKQKRLALTSNWDGMGFLVGRGLTVVHFFLSWELTSTTRLSFAHLRQKDKKNEAYDVLNSTVSSVSPPVHSHVQHSVILTCVAPWLSNTSCFCRLRWVGRFSSTDHRQTSSSDWEVQTFFVHWKAADDIWWKSG